MPVPVLAARLRDPSSAAFGKIGDGYVAEVHRGANAHGVEVRRFAKGENKEAIARPLIVAAEREGGDGRVVLIGIAQEKTAVWRSWKAKGQEHAVHRHMEVGPADSLRQPYACRSAGRLAEAIPLFEATLSDRERVLGADHPSTLIPRNNLADAYRSAERLDAAIRLFELGRTNDHPPVST